MKFIRALFESRPFLFSVLDMSLITQGAASGDQGAYALRASDSSYAAVYITDGHAITIDVGKIGASSLTIWWYNPRSGTATAGGTSNGTGLAVFTPPASGADWVLVLDNAKKSFPAPGSSSSQYPSKAHPISRAIRNGKTGGFGAKIETSSQRVYTTSKDAGCNLQGRAVSRNARLRLLARKFAD